MGMALQYEQFFKKWFSDAHPIAGVAATGTLTISGVVSDGEKVVVGSNTYEFDTNDTYTSGNIQVDVADLRNQATGTLTFSGVAIVTQTVTIGGTEVYEFCTTTAGEGNIAVVIGADTSADKAVTELVDAINANSELVTAVADTDADTVVVTAITKGTAGNSITTTETCTNAAFGGGTLLGGLATITAANAVTALVSAIDDNEEYVTAVDGDSDTVVVTYIVAGTDGNSVATTETMANGVWGAATLGSGAFATPVNCPAFIIISGVWYIADAPVTKYTVGGWQSATPA